jgi:hypothetical protein
MTAEPAAESALFLVTFRLFELRLAEFILGLLN